MKSPLVETEQIEQQLLLEAVYRKYHYDFRHYSPASIRRRLLQAKERFHCDSISMLQHQVLHDGEAFQKFLPFLTVQVSEMFRDPSYFLALRRDVVPHLRTYPSLKVWVAGCSAGEELYSLAILFREEGLESRTVFYATDINKEALKIAEAGVYSLDRVATFTRNHRQSGGKSSLSDYYTTGYNRAMFDKTLRAQTVFSDHSLVSDTVFAEMHLISCRNVLIYFDQTLQNRVFGLFNDSLVRRGFLGLGAKETLRFSDYMDSFTEWNREERIYQKQTAS